MEHNKAFQNIVVWIQSESTQEKNTVIIDDIAISEDDNRYNTYSRYVSDIDKGYKEIAVFESTSAYMIPNVGFLIMSHLVNKDSVGRRRAFSAIIKGKSLRTCLEKLRETLHLCGFQYNDIELNKIIDICKERQENKKKILTVCLTISFLVGLTILLKIL